MFSHLPVWSVHFWQEGKSQTTYERSRKQSERLTHPCVCMSLWIKDCVTYYFPFLFHFVSLFGDVKVTETLCYVVKLRLYLLSFLPESLSCIFLAVSDVSDIINSDLGGKTSTQGWSDRAKISLIRQFSCVLCRSLCSSAAHLIKSETQQPPSSSSTCDTFIGSLFKLYKSSCSSH